METLATLWKQTVEGLPDSLQRMLGKINDQLLTQPNPDTRAITGACIEMGLSNVEIAAIISVETLPKLGSIERLWAVCALPHNAKPMSRLNKLFDERRKDGRFIPFRDGRPLIGEEAAIYIAEQAAARKKYYDDLPKPFLNPKHATVGVAF